MAGVSMGVAAVAESKGGVAGAVVATVFHTVAASVRFLDAVKAHVSCAGVALRGR